MDFARLSAVVRFEVVNDDVTFPILSTIYDLDSYIIFADEFPDNPALGLATQQLHHCSSFIKVLDGVSTTIIHVWLSLARLTVLQYLTSRGQCCKPRTTHRHRAFSKTVLERRAVSKRLTTALAKKPRAQHFSYGCSFGAVTVAP